MKKYNQSGFSLLELMIVVAIVVILSVLALPSFRSYLANSRIINRANNVLAAFNQARASAISNSAVVRVDPALCSAIGAGVSDWACGAYVWKPDPTKPDTDAAPTTDTDTRIIAGPRTATGSDNATNVVSSPAPASTLARYTAAGRLQVNVGGAGWSDTAIAGAAGGSTDFMVGFCDIDKLIPKGPLFHVGLSGRAAVQAKAKTCP